MSRYPGNHPQPYLKHQTQPQQHAQVSNSMQQPPPNNPPPLYTEPSGNVYQQPYYAQPVPQQGYPPPAQPWNQAQQSNYQNPQYQQNYQNAAFARPQQQVVQPNFVQQQQPNAQPYGQQPPVQQRPYGQPSPPHGQQQQPYAQQQNYSSYQQGQQVQPSAPPPEQFGDANVNPNANPQNPNANPNPNPYQGAGDMEGKFDYSRPKYNDVWALVLFIIQLFIMVGVGVWAIMNLRSNQNSNPSNFDYSLSQVLKVTLVVSGGAAAAFIFALLWIAIIQRFASIIIKISMIGIIAMYGVGLVVAVVTGAVLLAVILAIILAFTLLYFYFVRRRIPLASAMLEIAAVVSKQYSSTIVVSFVFAIVMLVWVVFWSATFSSLYSRNAVSSAAFVLLLSFYWTAQVIANIVHVTVAGVAASWYFNGNPASPTKGAFKRATTTSLGSICFGSLIVAIIQALRALVQSARSQGEGNAFVMCCIECILSCFEDILEYINLYAFAQVAIYGKAFIPAAKATLQLFKTRGITALINDDLSGMVLGLGMLISGLVAALAAGLAAYFIDEIKDLWRESAFLAFLAGFFLLEVVMRVLRSTVVTTFVCWAEDPVALQNTHPENFQKLIDAMAKAGYSR